MFSYVFQSPGLGCLTGPISLCLDSFLCLCILCVYFVLIICCIIVTWWDAPAWIEAWSLGPLLPSGLWQCWLGHLTHKNLSPISYFYKGHKWVQECWWRCPRQGCICHESQLYAAKCDGIDTRTDARPSNHIYTAMLYQSTVHRPATVSG